MFDCIEMPEERREERTLNAKHLNVLYKNSYNDDDGDSDHIDDSNKKIK